jgi:hypothetical protein
MIPYKVNDQPNHHDQRAPQYENEDPVKMMITESGNTRFKTFLVAASKIVASHWVYQLKDPDTKSLWKEGQLFLETELESGE